jgi:phosphate transport system permease protein
MDKRFISRVRRRDRIASRVITVGGLIIIACVIGIVVLIGKVALPLFWGVEAQVISRLPLGKDHEAGWMAVGIDDYQEVAYALSKRGVFSFRQVDDGRVFQEVSVADSPEKAIETIERYKNSIFNILWMDGSVTVCQVIFRPDFDAAGKRTIHPAVEIRESIPREAFAEKPLRVLTRRAGEERFTVVALLSGNRFAIEHRVITRDIFDNEQTETVQHLIDERIEGNITAVAADERGNTLYAGTDSGNLLRWDLSDSGGVRQTDNVAAVSGKGAVTALALVFGDVSVAVGDESGGLATWMPVRSQSPQAEKKLRRIHVLKSHGGAVREIIPSRRTKSLVSLDRRGTVHIDHMTSENHLLQVGNSLLNLGVSDRDNSLVGIDQGNELRVWQIDNPHPEISLKTLFGKVWYEDYDRPEYVWQSSSGNDDFEPKFSIVPLLFGTFKGTLYAMLFAIPLSIFGAVYTSQFATASFKKTIKPAIEIMASVPSVVIGFLIALWLAPIVERQIVPILLSPFLLCGIFVLFMALMAPLQKFPRFHTTTRGFEFALLVPVLFLTVAATIYLGPVVEEWLFGGDFNRWLFHEAGMRYDQRNCIIIAFGLGIAVIPIIFSITDDAISNIPPSLTAASLALGASRWQTIWRVILPSASPGIFAAIMIGFGRAVGETMIVLMATGNTPILDWSIFNGMRTLSANIAVEIPEAPLGGTLYRVLFLCATILFALTFVLNTGAEVVRERLRKKYGRY